MSDSPVSTARYSVSRFTVEAGGTPDEFRSRYEEAVPPMPAEQVAGLVRRQAPWQEMLDLVAAAAPHGFLIYYKAHADPLVRLAGDRASGTGYLMGNHTIMERMFRHQPAVLLYAPLHTVVWGDPDGPAYFSFDKPSDQFASFGSPQVTDVGIELDRRMAALLEHLGVAVPDALRTSARSGAAMQRHAPGRDGQAAC
jgi:hypothetical protein